MPRRIIKAFAIAAAAMALWEAVVRLDLVSQIILAAPSHIVLAAAQDGGVFLHAFATTSIEIGAAIVIVAGYILVGKHRRLMLDEILAGIALLIWIVVDRVNDTLFGGPNPELVRIWSVRGAVFAVMIVAYAIARSQWHIEREKV